jgi:hypothetical protein
MTEIGFLTPLSAVNDRVNVDSIQRSFWLTNYTHYLASFKLTARQRRRRRRRHVNLPAAFQVHSLSLASDSE